MTIPDVPVKLFTAFNDVTYHDEPHKYFLDGEQLISVTTLLGKYENEFNEDFWAGKKSFEFDVPRDEIKHGWKYINKVGVTRGSIIHDYAENLFNNKVFPYPKERITKIFGNDPIYDSYIKVKAHVDKFHRFSQGRLIPIRLELVVFDRVYKIGGMVDLLFYNVKAKEFQIWDWKTNKEFDGWSKKDGYQADIGKDNYTGSLALLKKNDINHYSLQLGTYKHIIERNTGIKLGDSYLVWVSHLEDDFHIIKTLNRDFFVKQMINEYISSN